MTPATPTPKRILVVDDDRQMNEILRKKFNNAGFVAEGCYDGNEALALMGKNPYDAIVLDLLMPIKDGFAVLGERTSTLNAKTRVYTITAMGPDTSEKAESLGATKTFIKAQTSLHEIVEEIKKEL